jgi:hypothetical protein
VGHSNAVWFHWMTLSIVVITNIACETKKILDKMIFEFGGKRYLVKIYGRLILRSLSTVQKSVIITSWTHTANHNGGEMHVP